MVEMEDHFDDHPEVMEEKVSQGSYPFEFFEDQRGFGAAFGIALFLAPIGLMVGVMRWNIADTLDADLEWIFTKFCDTVLLFCIALPICPLLPGEWGNNLARRAFKGLWRLLMVAKWIGILVFITAAVISIAYCCWMLWKLVAG